MEELLKAISLVLEWHDENLSDGVNREFAIRELRQAYEAAQQTLALDAEAALQAKKDGDYKYWQEREPSWKLPRQ